MRKKDFVFVTKQHIILSVNSLNNLTMALDSLNYIFVCITIIEMRKYRLTYFLISTKEQ